MRARLMWWMTVSVMMLTLACGGSPSGPSGHVEYQIAGSATRVDITYQNSSGGTSQIANAAVPWTYSWTGAKSGDFLYVSAQIVSGTGSVTATIRKNGTVAQTSTSTGFATIATASGSY